MRKRIKKKDNKCIWQSKQYKSVKQPEIIKHKTRKNKR